MARGWGTMGVDSPWWPRKEKKRLLKRQEYWELIQSMVTEFQIERR